MTVTKRALFFTAKDTETKAVRAYLGDAKRYERSPRGNRLTIFSSSQPELNQSELEIAHYETGRGQFSAIQAAGQFIEAFDPDIVVYIGCAGGDNTCLDIGDVIVGTKIWNYEQASIGDDTYKYKPHPVFPASVLVDEAKGVADFGSWKKRLIGESSDTGKITFGEIASGDKVIKSVNVDIWKYIQADISDDIIACETEGHGFLAALEPTKSFALMIRGISDHLYDKGLSGKELDDDRQSIAASRATALAIQILDEIDVAPLRSTRYGRVRDEVEFSASKDNGENEVPAHTDHVSDEVAENDQAEFSEVDETNHDRAEPTTEQSDQSIFSSSDLVSYTTPESWTVNSFLSQSFDSIIDQYPFEELSSSIVCVAHSLAPKGSATEKMLDVMIKVVELSAKSSGLLGFRIGVGRTYNFNGIHSTQWRILDKNGSAIKAAHCIAESADGRGNIFAYFLFEELLSQELGPVKVGLTTSHKELMAGLGQRKGTEWMRSATHTNLEKQDYVLVYPKIPEKLSLFDLKDAVHRSSSPPSQPYAMLDRWKAGRVMTSAELEEYADFVGEGQSVLGWRCESLPAGFSSGVLIERN